MGETYGVAGNAIKLANVPGSPDLCFFFFHTANPGLHAGLQLYVNCVPIKLKCLLFR